MATENWCMSVGDKIYGPYSTDQMKAFVQAKRLAYHSMVAPAGSREFREAYQFAELRSLFGGKGGHERAAMSVSGRRFLVLFGTEDTARSAGEAVLGRLPGLTPLTTTAFIAEADGTADDLRDALARAVPNTERAIVIALDDHGLASHGLGLTEHEALRELLSRR